MYIAKDIWMDLAYAGVPLAQNPNSTMICVTTPTVIRTLQELLGSEFYSVRLYADGGPESIFNYEVGVYKIAAPDPLSPEWLTHRLAGQLGEERIEQAFVV